MPATVRTTRSYFKQAVIESFEAQKPSASGASSKDARSAGEIQSTTAVVNAHAGRLELQSASGP